MPDLQIKDGKVVYLDDSSPANTIYKLPTADGTTAQVIKTDGGGNLSFGDVSGTISISGSYGNSIIVNSTEDGGVSSDILHVDVANSRVGINDTTPSYTLDVNGTFRTTGNSILGDASGDSVTINAATIALANVAAGTDNTVLVYNGSSVVTDEIDSRVWGSTLVDGSGTANNVTKWSDSNTVTDSLITDNGTTVTIAGNLTVNGTTTTVNTTNTTVTDNLLELNSGVTSNANDTGIIIERGSTGNNALFIWDESADKFALGTTTATASSTGNITYTDAGLIAGTLDISGDAAFDTDTLFVDVSADRVGIGTTSPNSLIHASLSGDLNNGGFEVDVPSSNRTLKITTGDTMQIDAYNSNSTGVKRDISILPSGGNVGIGTSSPQGHLHINTESAEATEVYIDGETNQQKSVELRHYDASEVSGTGRNTFYLKTKAADKVTLGGYDNSSSEFEVVTFQENGYVGVGTASPEAELHVQGPAGSSAEIYLTDGDDTGGSNSLLLQQSGGTSYVRNRKSTGSLYLGAGDGNHLNILSGGNVGIGTTSPSHKLSVHGDSDGNRTEIGIDNLDQRLVLGAYYELGVAQYATIQATNNAENSAKDLVLQPDGGNVGIGTDDPSDALHVVGIGKITSAVLTPLVKSGNASGNVILQGGNSGGANIELYGESHASLANDAYYDADVHNFRSASAATAYATFATAEIDFTRTLNMNNNNITGVNSLTIQDPGPDEGIIFGGGSGWSIYESPDDLTTNSGGNLQFVDSGSRIFTLNTSGNGDFTGDLSVDGTIKGAAGANSGDAFLIGNDSKLVDIDVVNTGGLYGTSNTAEGGLKLGSGGPTLYGKGSNLGIGTTSPSSLLHLSSTGPTILTIEADTDNVTETDNARIVLKQDGGGVNGRIGYANNTNSLEFINEYPESVLIGTNNSADLTINSSGIASFRRNRIDISDNTDQNLGVGFAAMDALTSGIQNTGAGIYALSGVTSGNYNTAFGYQAGIDITTQSYNTLMGRYAGANTIGNSNTFIGLSSGFGVNASSTGGTNVGIGLDSLKSYTTGYENVAVGADTLEALTSGYNNVAIGKSSGIAVTDGFRNTLVGSESGLNLTTGDYNTLIGRAAGYDQTTASHNTAIGASAGENMTSGGNVFVGSQSGLNATSGVNTAVGYQTLEQCTTGTLNTAIGYRAMDTLTTASNHTAVGTYAGLGSDPSSSAPNVWVGYDAGNGPVGTCTGVGNVGIGGQAMTSHTTSAGVTCIGYQSGLYLQTANDSVGIGRNTFEGEAARLVTGASNVAIGPYAMRRAKSGVGNISMGRSALHGPSGTGTTGNYNVALGYESGFDVSSGSYNVMTGFRAGNNISSGGTNTAIGTEALYSATSAEANVAVGRQALFNLTDGLNNTAIGRNSLDSTTTGDYNVAVGYQALDANITGGAKTAVGYQALQNDTGASISTAVGYQALLNQSTGLYNVAIGHSAGLSVTTNNDNVFIGTTTGLSTTGANNTMVGFQAGYTNTSGESNTMVGRHAGYDQTTGSNNLLLGHNAGRSTSPSGIITTGSNIVCLGDNNISDLYCADTTISSSDARDKTDVEDFSAGLDFVNKLRPVTYRWDKRSRYITKENDDILSITPDGTHKEARQHLGFLAQEVEEIEKEFGYSQTKDSQLVVNTNEDETAMGIKYERLVPVLVNAIKELSAEVEKLKSQLNQS
jgi:hypothetical protein